MISVEKIGDGPAIAVSGLGPGDLDDASVQAELRKLWYDHGVVVFRDGGDERFQVELSGVFGPTAEHKIKSHLSSNPDLIDLIVRLDNADVDEVAGEQRAWYLPWHTDLIYVDEINHGGILRPIELPVGGSQTAFLDKSAVYERLPNHLKAEVEGLEAIYKADFQPQNSKFGIPPKDRPVRNIRLSSSKGGPSGSIAFMKDAPRVIHPMVFTHPNSGKKILNVSPWFAVGIFGRENAEGDRLLQQVVDHIFSAAEDPDCTYVHHWRLGEMVLWDNWSVLHSTPGTDPTQRRHMQRTTIVGDYSLGRKERPDQEIAQQFRRMV